MDHDIRWQQRFRNFDRAIALLSEPIERGVHTLSALEKEGTVQRFEYAVELAWKTLKDYLECEGRVLETVTPKQVIKEAFDARILADGQIWIDMTNRRSVSRQYDESTFNEAVLAIAGRYFTALQDLHIWLREHQVNQ
jgi:nucleotidyltransferase substrate binding protein (TIGR01987 family)